MENLKIKVNDEAESKEVQELLYYLDYNGKPYLLTNEKMRKDGCRNDYEIGFLFAELGGNVACAHKTETKYFDYHPYEEITLQKLKDLAVLKRNSIDDATHTGRSGSQYYIGAESYFWDGIKWEQRDFLNLGHLKPIEKEVKKKEFLNPEQGYALVECFVGETPIPESWIEIPEGAEILYFEKLYESANHFFKTVNGKSYYKYLEKYSEWIEYGIEGLDDFKEMIDNFRIMWQRNPETTNTSIQEKLKFIEKWLNGEKIQYILGIESEKTQTDESKWHNFTEGAMQYIKRSDIKFREAPKYVTINGIEFKSVEKLLKYVKKNFDLEDGE